MSDAGKPELTNCTASMRRFALLGVLGLGVAACAAPIQQAAVGPSPGLVPTDGTSHSEPVVYNGERYEVTFRFKQALNGYDLSVTRRKPGLKQSDKDRDDAFQVATSALTHFACPNGQKAQMIDGSQAYAKRVWRTSARCA